jgi:hypothetical protein
MKDKSVVIPIEFEYLLSHLFGKQNYHAITGTNNIKFLKNTYTKIFKSIKRAVELNIISSDEVLIEDLVYICENSLLELKQKYTAELLNIKMSTYLTKIVFLLIGQFPSNWDKHKTNFKKEWILNRYRTINYTSDFQQRCFLILDNYNKHSNPSQHPKLNKLWDKLNYEFKNDYSKFVKWFKKNYFDIYKKII